MASAWTWRKPKSKRWGGASGTKAKRASVRPLASKSPPAKNRLKTKPDNLPGSGEIMSVPPADLLSAFGETILLLDRSRCVVNALGETKALFGCAPGELIGTPWTHLIDSFDSCDALYWAVESAF